MQEAQQSQSHGLEWNGEAYHALSDMQYAVGMQLLDSLTLRGDETLVDAGCGSGRITLEILARLPKGRVIGVDLGESMLQTARRVVRPEPGQDAQFIQADLQTFVLPHPVDGIFSNMCLHFVHDHGVLFQNFYRMLKHEGFVALQFGAADQARMMSRALKMMNEPPFGEYLHGSAFDFRGAEVEDTERHLEAAGFVDIQVHKLEQPQVPEQREKMMRFLDETVRRDCARLLPTEALRQRFDEQIVALMADAFEQPLSYLRVLARRP